MERIFESRLSAPPERAWQWATSIDGISAELRPWLRMTTPPGMKTLTDLTPRLGTPLFRSYVYLFGVLPIDRSDLTLLELEPGRRFQEESPMLSMRRWRHERTITPDAAGCVLRDRLEFEPRMLAPLVVWFIERVFANRHRVLRRELG